MAETHVISALTTKRAELAGKIQHYQSEIIKFEDELNYIDGAIKVFDPDYKINSIKSIVKRDPNNWFNNGELPRLTLDILKKEKSPLSTFEMVEKIARLKNLNIDKSDKKKIQCSLGHILRKYSKQNIVHRTGEKGPSGAMIWNISQ